MTLPTPCTGERGHDVCPVRDECMRHWALSLAWAPVTRWSTCAVTEDGLRLGFVPVFLHVDTHTAERRVAA